MRRGQEGKREERGEGEREGEEGKRREGKRGRKGKERGRKREEEGGGEEEREEGKEARERACALQSHPAGFRAALSTAGAALDMPTAGSSHTLQVTE